MLSVAVAVAVDRVVQAVQVGLVDLVKSLRLLGATPVSVPVPPVLAPQALQKPVSLTAVVVVVVVISGLARLFTLTLVAVLVVLVVSVVQAVGGKVTAKP